MLEECWMKVYIICACHSTCFIQYPSSYMLSFCIKSNMVTDMLLPVILSELLESDAGKPHQSKTRQWIKQRHSCFLSRKFHRRFNVVVRLISLRESHTTSNQRWNNVVFVNIETYNIEFRINVVYFNAYINSVRQHRNNVLFSNVEFHNIDKVETTLRISQFEKLLKGA